MSPQHYKNDKIIAKKNAEDQFFPGQNFIFQEIQSQEPEIFVKRKLGKQDCSAYSTELSQQVKTIQSEKQTKLKVRAYQRIGINKGYYWAKQYKSLFAKNCQLVLATYQSGFYKVWEKNNHRMKNITFQCQALSETFADKISQRENQGDYNQLLQCRYASKTRIQIEKILNESPIEFENPLLLKKISEYQKQGQIRTIKMYFQKINQVFDQMFEELQKYSIQNKQIQRKAEQFSLNIRASQILLKNAPQKLMKKIIRQARLHETASSISIINNQVETAFSQRVFQELTKFKQDKPVKMINIQYCKDLSENSALSIAENITNLIQLRLQCFQDDLPLQFFTCLAQKSPNLRFFCYNIDWRNCFTDQWQHGYFTNLEWRNFAISSTNLKELVKLKYIQNVWIGQVDSQQSVGVCQKIKNLRDLQLGDAYERSINERLIQQLQHKTILYSITLKSIGNCNNLIKVFQQNKFLQSIIFHRCQFDNSIIDTIKNKNKRLKQLVIIQNNTLRETSVWEITSLKVLVLNNVPRISSKQATKIKHFRHLKYLDLSWNSWVDDSLMELIAISGSPLKSLNIFQTKVSGNGLRQLSILKGLETLICGENLISGKDILELTKKCRKIKKLSIFGLSGISGKGKVTQKQLQGIFKSLKLTHLDIRSCPQIKIQNIELLNLQTLKCLKYSKMDEDSDEDYRLSKFGIHIYS